jgi:hypothetical protein
MPSPAGGGLYKDSCPTGLFPLENIASTCSRVEVCHRSAHCEGINSCQPHNLSIFLLLAVPTGSAHGRADATGLVRHKRVWCNSDTIFCPNICANIFYYVRTVIDATSILPCEVDAPPV